MLVEWVRWHKGWVEFRAVGKFPERFLNVSAKNGVHVWNACPCDGGVTGCMAVSDYRRIRKTAKKARVRTRVTRRHGLPFWISRYRVRLGLPVGAAIGMVLLIVLSGFVWTEKVTGAQTVSETKILRTVQEKGIGVGTFKGSVDVRKTEREVLLEMPELSWISVNILGSHAEIEVREKAKKPKVPDLQEYGNIKASRDGVVTAIKVRQGSTKVKKGSGVSEGDLLVSGMMQTKRNTTRFLGADADIYADVHSNLELKLPQSSQYYSITENKTDRCCLWMLGVPVPASLSFQAYPDAAYTYRGDCFTLGGVKLPLRMLTRSAHELQSGDFSLGRQQAETAFHNAMLLYEAFNCPKSRVVSRSVDFKKDKNEYFCNIEYILNENIAKKSKFIVTESK